MLLVTMIQEYMYPSEYSLIQQIFVCFYYEKDTVPETRTTMMRPVEGEDSH